MFTFVHLCSLLFTFVHLCSACVPLVFTCVPLVFTYVHLCSLVSTCVHLCSTCVHLCLLVFVCVLLVFVCVLLMFICIHLCSPLCGVLGNARLSPLHAKWKYMFAWWRPNKGQSQFSTQQRSESVFSVYGTLLRRGSQPTVQAMRKPRVDKWYGDRWSHLCPKKWLIFTNLGQALSSKVGFFLISWQILQAVFFDKMLAFSNKKPTFVLFSGFFCMLYFHNFVETLFKRSLFN